MPLAVRRVRPRCPVAPRPRPTASVRGYDHAWHVLSSLYREQHPVCEYCWQALTELVHHIKPVATHPHLRLDAGNLKAACLACHGKLHAGDHHH